MKRNTSDSYSYHSNNSDSTIATMAVTEAKILTAETVPAYLEDHLDQLKDVLGAKDGTKQLFKANTIQGGNVNYAFCVTEETSSRTVFLKQAPEFVAIFGPDGFPLSSARMQQEMDVYEEWKQLLGPTLAQKYLPNIYFFDSTFCSFDCLCDRCEQKKSGLVFCLIRIFSRSSDLTLDSLILLCISLYSIWPNL